MKRKITLLLLAAGSLFKMNSQVMLSEDFTASAFTLATSGWGVVDNSTPSSGVSWFQGNQTTGNGTIPAYNGSTNDFYMSDFTAINGTAAGTISAFLITPTVTIYNGAVLQFATRTANQTAPNIYADRLQVLMSSAGVPSVIPTGPTSVGTFTNTLLDINPALTTNNASVVTNGTVNGYPFAWTVYTLQITGVTGTVTGRFAFRYYVNNGGSGGANSRLVGVDAVRYTLPCGPTVQSFTTCAGASTTLNAVGLPATTYSWNTGATTSSIVVNPSSTTTYSLYPLANGNPCGSTVTAVVTVSSNLAISVAASNNTVCAGTAITLTATGPSSSYFWAENGTPISGANAAVITVTPSSNTTYSVGALVGTCFGGNTIAIVANPLPTVNITAPSTLVCLHGPSVAVSFTGSGAATNTAYVWVTGASQASGTNVIGLTIPAQTSTTSAAFTITLGLIGVTNGCAGTKVFTLTAEQTPSVSVTSTTNNACTNSTVNITASLTNSAVINTYSWSGAATGASSVLAFATGTTTGIQVFSLQITGPNGCTNTASFSQNVVSCTTNTNTVGLGNLSGYEETAIFPNPFSSEIKISSFDGRITIFNAIGQAVINTTVRSSETINTENLPKGAYMLKAYNANGETVKTVKMVKN